MTPDMWLRELRSWLISRGRVAVYGQMLEQDAKHLDIEDIAPGFVAMDEAYQEWADGLHGRNESQSREIENLTRAIRRAYDDHKEGRA